MEMCVQEGREQEPSRSVGGGEGSRAGQKNKPGCDAVPMEA